MSVLVFNDRLKDYKAKTIQEEENAIKEIVQELCLAGLARHGFFKKAAFQGETCLRICYQLPRFSEDLDFILIKPNLNFEMKQFLRGALEELSLYGLDFEIQDRADASKIIKKAFLKNDSWGKILTLNFSTKASKRDAKKITIKIEVDSSPPLGSIFEDKVINFPYPNSIITQDLPSLFAGKMHALLCRPYIKGRDWYDFLWYTRKKIKLNYVFLQNALHQNGPWQNQDFPITQDWVKAQLEKQVTSIDWKQTQADVQQFIKPNEVSSLKLWSSKFFLAQVSQYFEEAQT